MGDALLLEPPIPRLLTDAELQTAPPILDVFAKSDIWISNRTDSLGSGTQSDPFSGTVRNLPAVAISSFDRTDREVTVNVSSTDIDKFVNGDAVIIDGSGGDAAYKGTFPIYGWTKDEVSTPHKYFFKYYLQTVPTGSTPTSPTATKLRACLKTQNRQD